MIVGDPERLQQVVVNLLDNAIEHNEVSEPIQLSIRPERGTVALSVEDRGPGIPEEELDRVFERFHTAGADRPPDGTGSGLGLAISKWIVELHGGTIVASNRPGHGCVVEVSLPLSLSPAAQP